MAWHVAYFNLVTFTLITEPYGGLLFRGQSNNIVNVIKS